MVYYCLENSTHTFLISVLNQNLHHSQTSVANQHNVEIELRTRTNYSMRASAPRATRRESQ